jgi:hypothetical protein
MYSASADFKSGSDASIVATRCGAAAASTDSARTLLMKVSSVSAGRVTCAPVPLDTPPPGTLRLAQPAKARDNTTQAANRTEGVLDD